MVLYQKSLTAALSYAKTISEEEIEKLKKVDQMLLPVKSRNARMDFFSLDEQLGCKWCHLLFGMGKNMEQ